MKLIKYLRIQLLSRSSTNKNHCDKWILLSRQIVCSPPPRLHGRCWPPIWRPEGASVWPGQPVYTVYYYSGKMAQVLSPMERVCENACQLVLIKQLQTIHPEGGQCVCEWLHAWMHTCMWALQCESIYCTVLGTFVSFPICNRYSHCF